MKQKKIAVVYILTKMELGGAQKVCLSLFNGLKQNNIHTVLLTSHGKLSESIDNDSEIIYLDSLNREFSFKNIFTEISTLFKLIKYIRTLKKDYDTVIVHTHSTKAGILGRWASFFAGAKLRIHTVHGFAFHNHQSLFKWFAIYFIELITSFITSHYICVSSADVKTGTNLFPNFRYKHTIIRAAIEWKNFYIPSHKIDIKEFDKSKDFVFGTISCFKPQKNLIDLLQAFKLVHEKNRRTRLEIIGDGEQRPEIENWIKKNNLQSSVVLHGWQERVASFMLSWDTFVLTSLWEGLPCAVVEARLLKLPVLSYNTGGIHDVIISGKNGMLFRQKDWQALAQGMLNLSLNKELYKNLQAHADNLKDFNDETMVAQHIKLYNKLTK